MPVHEGIDGNETTDQLTKDARLLNNGSSYHLALFDANAMTKYRLRKPSIKKSFQIWEINESKNITKKITRLRISHFKGKRIDGDGERTYAHCSHSSETE
ncbi:hypothetical protein AVEN_210785-1 [Araneus ventricosus]|uniref:Uncharacterized protein n=1 Tax=Araneus ventricosus TaxID=182803 RepID=A0A4Y2CL00_ARAVE|nr:hypothetical protein AVEN_210785-1 [Araneus ventricosus]